MRRNYFFLFILILSLSLPGCNLPLPTCDTASLQAVTLVSPADWSTVDSLNPTLEWTYPDATCNPEGYAIRLKTGPLYEDNIGGGTGNPSTSWGPGSPLEPGKTYAWGVAPINGTTLGPWEVYNTFFTGPTCATADLVAPVLLFPEDGGAYDHPSQSLTWDYPLDCSPESYRIDLDTEPAFSDPGLGGGTGNPSTLWGPADPIADCETYYWRVAGINGTTLGPFSPVFSFVMNLSGECNMPASASISGIVWDDQCDLPDGPLPAPLPTGCISDGAGSAQANGIREAGEPGIPGVRVDLHWGGCATVPVANSLTDADGHYVFDGLLAFGSYCLAIRPLEAPNDSVLIPGDWTFPFGLSGADAFANAMVEEGTSLTDKDFGWDYQFGGSSPTPVPSSTPTPVAAIGPQFVLDKNAFCRKGPSQFFIDVTAIPVGEIVGILGVNNDNGPWYFVEWKKFSAKCWVSASTGHTIGDLTGIPVLVSPATPTPVPAIIPSVVPTNTGKP